jgi:predicted nucleic acid-binding protein
LKIKIKTVYCDTSVIGGIADLEFSEASKQFLKNVRAGLFSLVISPVVDDEINASGTPVLVIKEYEKLLEYCEIAQVTEDALELQSAYLKEKILSPQWEDDALHVALATVYGCDIIVSWNFKHIVNFQKIPLYNAVNKLLGYNEIQIYSPLELVAAYEK